MSATDVADVSATDVADVSATDVADVSATDVADVSATDVADVTATRGVTNWFEISYTSVKSCLKYEILCCYRDSDSILVLVP